MSEKLYKDISTFKVLADELISEFNSKAISIKHNPLEVLKKFDISLDENGISEEKFIKILRNIVLNTPKTSGNLFFNQLFGGLNSKAALGDLLAVILNNSMATYKISGPMVEIEKEILKKVSSIINYPKEYGGTIATGGSMCNFMALIIARDKKNNTIKNKGNSGKLICYASENAHYSIDKNASFSGIGRDNVRHINTNKKGEIDVIELEKKIIEDKKNGLNPFFVNISIGTTVMGAIDPIKEISIICKKYDLWMHIDGSYCGSIIFSNQYKYLIEGINESDSFCFNPHKTLGAPLSSSVFLVRNKKHLSNSFSNKAEYLYQTDDDDYNLGKFSFECGRRNNSLKFWTLWKSIGTKGIEKMVDHNYELSHYAREYIKKNSDKYTLYSYENSLSICFNYKNIDPIKLCTELYNKNKLMVGYGNHKNNTFVRLVTVNRENTKNDILNFFKTLEDFANENL
tara:strand:- start:92068 stop:93441 length:1374 start_codon:yes stop_codon:yes gene_type:complete